jgi:hypothetical protein
MPQRFAFLAARPRGDVQALEPTMFARQDAEGLVFPISCDDSYSFSDLSIPVEGSADMDGSSSTSDSGELCPVPPSAALQAAVGLPFAASVLSAVEHRRLIAFNSRGAVPSLFSVVPPSALLVRAAATADRRSLAKPRLPGDPLFEVPFAMSMQGSYALLSRTRTQPRDEDSSSDSTLLGARLGRRTLRHSLPVLPLPARVPPSPAYAAIDAGAGAAGRDRTVIQLPGVHLALLPFRSSVALSAQQDATFAARYPLRPDVPLSQIRHVFRSMTRLAADDWAFDPHNMSAERRPYVAGSDSDSSTSSVSSRSLEPLVGVSTVALAVTYLERLLLRSLVPPGLLPQAAGAAVLLAAKFNEPALPSRMGALLTAISSQLAVPRASPAAGEISVWTALHLSLLPPSGVIEHAISRVRLTLADDDRSVRSDASESDESELWPPPLEPQPRQ